MIIVVTAYSLWREWRQIRGGTTLTADEQTVAAICRDHGIAENTFYRWRKAYGGMSVNEAQRRKELEIVGRMYPRLQ